MEELKICETCKHCFCNPSMQPCRDCIREIVNLETCAVGDPSNWEPREEENR